MLISTAESVPVRRPKSPPVHDWKLQRTWLVAALLWLATMALYWPVVHHDFIGFDDDEYVNDNAMVQQGLAIDSLKWALVTPVCGNWHPLTMMSHLLDCQLYGLDPGKHHLTSLLFHACNVVLAFLLFRRLTGAFWRSACVAALFAWHPLHVESVAWIAERKDVLSAFFGLLSLLAYVAYVRDVRQPARPFYNSASYWLAWVCLALGLLCKPMLVTWPCLLLLLDFWPLQRLQPARLQPSSGGVDAASPATATPPAPSLNLRQLLIEKIPFFALAAALCVLTFLVQKSMGAMSALAHEPLAGRCENALISWCRYLEKTFWPVDLSIFYPYPGHWPLAWVLLSALFLGTISVLCWRVRQRQPLLLMGWGWFVGTLVPVIGLVQVGSQAMADRYTYLPSLGLFVLLVWAARDVSQRWPHQTLLAAAASLVVLLACGAVTRHQLAYWQNGETLFRHALQVTADNELDRNCLGHALMRAGRTDEAIDQFRNAVRLQPEAEEAHYNLGTALAAEGQTNDAIHELSSAIQCQSKRSETYNNLAILLAARGQTNEANRNFQLALSFNPEDANSHFNYANFLAGGGDLKGAINEMQQTARLTPKDAEIRHRLGLLLAKTGQPDAALREYAEAIRLNTNDADSFYQLGNLETRAGRKDQALLLYQQAVRARPDFTEARNNLGSLLSAQGYLPEAIAQFREAIRTRPDQRDLHYNLGNALLKTGQFHAAAAEYQTVIQLAPDFAPAHFYLGVVLEQTGQTNYAIAQFRETLRLRPNDAATHDRLGLALAGQGQIEEATSEFKTALRLEPNFTEASNHLARLRPKDGSPPKH